MGLRLLFSFSILSSLALLSACGKSSGSTGVSFTASAYTDGGREFAPMPFPVTLFPSRAPSDFKFCSTKLKLKDSSGAAVGGADSLEIVMGLVDVGTGAADKTLATVAIPVDFSLGKMEVELHRDPQKCSSADYSVRYNGQQLTKDLEFKFKFDPAVTVKQGDTLKLAFTTITSALKAAQNASAFNDENIASYLQSTTEGSGSK